MKAIENGGPWIDKYLERKPKELGKVAQDLRQLMKKAVPGCKETVNPWKMPTFEFNGPMCYFSIGTQHVTFGFLRGTSLTDPAELLEGTGKNLKHVKLRASSDVKNPALKRLIQSAAQLNQKEPMQAMKVNKK